MPTQWNGDENLRQLQLQAAANLLVAAIAFENELRQRVSVPNPPPHLDSSKPGEYPRLRTGVGQRALTHQPATPAEVVRAGGVRVGYVQGNHHLLTLELAWRRKGLLDTLEEMRPQLAALATGRFRG